MKRTILFVFAAAAVTCGVLFLRPSFFTPQRAQAAPQVYASPVHAGCYIAGPSECRIHVEPITIYLGAGRKMVYFQLVSSSGGVQKVLYDWKPDASNPAPSSGDTFSPSQVAQDFAVTCGSSYQVSLLGRDTGDAVAYSLGVTGQFTCPSSMP